MRGGTQAEERRIVNKPLPDTCSRLGYAVRELLLVEDANHIASKYRRGSVMYGWVSQTIRRRRYEVRCTIDHLRQP